MLARCGVVTALSVVLALATAAQAQAPGDAISSALAKYVEGPSRYLVGPIGLTATGRGITALEPTVPAVATQPRIVIVAGLDGSSDGTRALLDLLAWRFAPGTETKNRARWQVAAVPCALPDRCQATNGTTTTALTSTPVFPPDKGFYDVAEFREARFLWRWTAMLGPDLVIDVRSGPTLAWQSNVLARDRVSASAAAAADSFVGALGTGAPSGLAPVPALQVSGPPADVTRALRALLEGAGAAVPSPMNRALTARQSRTPLEIARMLAARYPANPIMSYIPALSWSGALRLSAITGDPQYRERAVAQMAPFLSGEKPAIAEPYLLTSLAGHQAFFDLAEMGGNAAADALARTAAAFILGGQRDGAIRFTTSWTDDMFMATSVLARAAKRTGEAKYADAMARLLTSYAAKLQREDRVFIHAESGPHAWGRGNGFAAFGLMDALTYLPESWSARPQVLDSFRRLMNGMRRHQAPDGSWHQVIDEPGTYREFTATAMVVAAMARGVRLGWLDASFQNVVDRGWRAVQARVSESGELVDVCTGTGAGQNATREYYVNRPALFGADDRGGAMALTAALEMQALTGAK